MEAFEEEGAHDQVMHEDGQRLFVTDVCAARRFRHRDVALY